MSDGTYALKLGWTCPHCGEGMYVILKRDLYKPDAPLLAALSHGLFDTPLQWRRVTRFDDVVRLPDPGHPVT